MNKFWSKNKLQNLYIKKGNSVPQIAKILNCSEHKINYWLAKNDIKKRSISEAIYLKNNPDGDPFHFNRPQNIKEAKLFGLGLGLYWGEGNKLSKNAVRVANSDPFLLKKFIEFLYRFFNIHKKDLRFHLHLFSDININDAFRYWTDKLEVERTQFYKPTITQTGKIGNYKNKSQYGVVTIYYGNTKLKNKLIKFIKDYS